MKTIRVVAAVISRTENGKMEILATQRGYGDYKDSWEFPGGKIEPGETAEDALVREIQEELRVRIAIDSFLQTVEYDYPKFHLCMDCFMCHIDEGELVLTEHEAAKWLDLEHLADLDWLPSDLEVIDNLKENYSLQK